MKYKEINFISNLKMNEILLSEEKEKEKNEKNSVLFLQSLNELNSEF